MSANMDMQKMGQLIMKCRKERGLTQKALGEKLNVTDKAVSKWERGLSYPDITLIPRLSAALEVSVSELISGRQNVSEEMRIGEVEEIVNNTLSYTSHVYKSKNSLFFGILTVLFLAATGVCLICDVAVNKRVSWSLYPTGAMAMVWLTAVPALYSSKYRLLSSILVFTVTALGYLFLIQALAPVKGWVVPLALPILLLADVAVIVSVQLKNRFKHNVLLLASIFTFMYGVVINFVVNQIVDTFSVDPYQDISQPIVLIVFIIASAILFILSLIKSKERRLQ